MYQQAQDSHANPAELAVGVADGSTIDASMKMPIAGTLRTIVAMRSINKLIR